MTDDTTIDQFKSTGPMQLEEYTSILREMAEQPPGGRTLTKKWTMWMAISSTAN